MSYDQVRDVAELLQLPVEDRPRRIAEHVHRIQVDKSGRPYIDHPRRVAENVQFLPAFENLSPAEQADAVAAAWLHDVIEDSGDDAWPPVMPEDLVRWGIPLEVVEIVLLLTRARGDKDKDAYYLRINENPLARLVKIADVADNCNEQRILWVEDAGGKRDPQRYAHALEMLALSNEEKISFDLRVSLPAELDGMQDERLMKFGAREDSNGRYLTLYCMDAGFGQWRFDKSLSGWVETDRMLDLIIKGDVDFDIISLNQAKEHFPEAFPMVQKEGDKNG